MQILAIIFWAAVGLQTLYYFIFLIVFARKRKSFSPQTGSVSVIVCAHDEEENLRTLLPLLLDQDHPDFEVIVVNDRSNDNTSDFLVEEAAKTSKLKMVNIDRTPDRMNPKKYALTLGIKVAKKEIILLTDADCRPETRSWVSHMSGAFQEKTQIVLGYSPYCESKGLLNRFIRFETLLTGMQYIGYAMMGLPYMGVGRNLAYMRSLFIGGKGFHDFISITGGDDDLFINQHAKAGNTAVCIGQEVTMPSLPKKTWRAFFRQKVRHLSVGKRYKTSHKLILSLSVLSHLVTWCIGIPLLFFYMPWYYIAAPLAFRVLISMITLHVSSRKLGDRFNVWPVIFLDFLYVFYYISTGLAALLTKKVQWRS